jgi:hypothetical protein
MALNHRSLGGIAIVFIMGCSVDGSRAGAHTAPSSIIPAGAGITLGFATQLGSADGARNVAGQATPTPLQAGANVVTTSPEIPGEFNFGPTPVGTIQQVTWTVTNIGDTATGALALTATPVPQFSASAVSCAPLAVLESCSVTITYAPGDSLEEHSSTFSVVGFPGSSYVFSGSGRPPFGPENP